MENNKSNHTNNNFQEIQTVFSQLLVEVADLCQSSQEAETIVEDLILALRDDDDDDDDSTGGGGKEEEEGNSAVVAVKNEMILVVSPRTVWNAIEKYFELDQEERKTAFRKCQEYYCRQVHVNQRRKLPPYEETVATFFLDSGEVHQDESEQGSLLFSSSHHHDDHECSEYSDKESNEDDDDDSEDESAYYFMNDSDESYCELCERTNIKLTKHHLIPKSTWPRIRTRLLHAMEALQRGDVNKHNMILGGTNLGQILATVFLSFSSKTTTGTTRIRSNSHNKSKQQQSSEKNCGKLLLLDQQHHNNRHRAHIRQALSSNTCNICRQCHSMVHSTHDNMTLALEYNTIETLLDDSGISKYCHWASKQRAGKYRL